MSESIRNLKRSFLILGDVGAMYLALYFTLFLRYRGIFIEERWSLHFWPFTISFVFWLAILYIVGLYDVRKMRDRMTLISLTSEVLVSSFLFSLALFYLVPSFGVAPKINLIITVGLFGLFFVGWRLLTMRIFKNGNLRLRTVFLGHAPETESVIMTIRNNPQLGYDVVNVLETVPENSSALDADIIIVSHHLDESATLTRSLFTRFIARTVVIPFPDFHEHLHRNVAESAISEQWILQNIASRDVGLYEILKRPLDILLACIISLPAFALSPFIALAILLDSGLPIFYTQERVGRGGRTFMIVKFRTMYNSAEDAGASFAKEDDSRITHIGKFLRASRLDELPQLWNIVRGDMSFVGPRPERPRHESELTESIPLFPIRRMIRPGLTGWAQVHAGYASEIRDHRKKLRHDLYYLKYQSLTLDIAIILRTIYSVLKQRGR